MGLALIGEKAETEETEKHQQGGQTGGPAEAASTHRPASAAPPCAARAALCSEGGAGPHPCELASDDVV